MLELVVYVLIASFALPENSMSGDKFSSQGNALYKSILDELIRQGVCSDNQSCSNALRLYSEDGDRIYMNMYGQTDKRLGSVVAKHIIENGIGLTGGVPITLRIYASQKSENTGFRSFIKRGASVTLEIDK